MQTVPSADKALLEGAIEIARSGGAEARKWFRNSSLVVDHKSDGSPVTQADRAAEIIIKDQIEQLTPGSSIIGEEHGTVTGESEYTWYVDPIDGTKGFSRGVPLYSTLLAMDDEHGPAIGVIYIPSTDEIVWAGRGLGCHTPDGPARVSSTKALEGAFVTTSSVTRWNDGVYDRLKAAGATIVGWGDGYGFLMVATGRVDAMVDLTVPGVWDIAPLRTIIGEAGGIYSGVDGTESIDNRDAIATNGDLHDEILKAVNG